ncbi:hypothetical protein BHM03_00015584 [Ensete ventricosum]|nr:hypothetical protein BHM03_00015584 [Ensete ventricosum]
MPVGATDYNATPAREASSACPKDSYSWAGRPPGAHNDRGLANQVTARGGITSLRTWTIVAYAGATVVAIVERKGQQGLGFLFSGKGLFYPSEFKKFLVCHLLEFPEYPQQF